MGGILELSPEQVRRLLPGELLWGLLRRAAGLAGDGGKGARHDHPDGGDGRSAGLGQIRGARDGQVRATGARAVYGPRVRAARNSRRSRSHRRPDKHPEAARSPARPGGKHDSLPRIHRRDVLAAARPGPDGLDPRAGPASLRQRASKNRSRRGIIYPTKRYSSGEGDHGIVKPCSVGGSGSFGGGRGVDCVVRRRSGERRSRLRNLRPTVLLPDRGD
jgi:hypothetical protein